MNITTLGLVGTGTMGREIARLAAHAGMDVLMFDTREGTAETTRSAILANLNPDLDADQRSSIEHRLRPVTTLQALAGCPIVVEAIEENLDAKQTLFVELEAIVAENCILATSTSALSITAIAATCRLPGRIAGFHFINPALHTRIVEVIQGLHTAPEVLDTLQDIGQRLGRTVIRAKDAPGFVVNHAGRAFITEGLRLLDENVAAVHDIDRIMRDVAGFPLGPLELLDRMGIDIYHQVMEALYTRFYQEPRFRPSPLAQQRLTGGLLGCKTQRGFYEYDGDRISGPAAALHEAPAPTLDLTRLPPLWISQAHPELARTVVDLVTRLGAAVETGLRPSKHALCIVTPCGQDATTCANREGLDATRTMAIDVIFGLAPGKRRNLMTTPITSAATRQAVHALFAADDTPVTVIHDSAGFVAQRIVAHTVNVGCDIAQQGIATPEDIDQAVTLGQGYPQGPLAFGDTIGPKCILDILDCLFNIYRDPRYRPSPWLRRRALLGVSLLTPEA